MSIYSIPPLIVSIFTISVGILVLIRGKKLIYALTTFSVFIWLLGYAIVYSTQDYEKALFFVKILYIGIIFIPTFSYHFTIIFLNLKNHKKIIRFNYFLSVIFSLLTQNKLFIPGLHKYYWGYQEEGGPLQDLFLIYFAIIMSRVIILLFTHYRQKKKDSLFLEATRIRYVLISFFVSMFASTDFLPNFGFKFYPLGFLCIAFHATATTYAILKYRLMDIELAWKYTASYILYGLVSSAIFICLAFFLRQWFLGIAIVIFLAVLATPYFYRFLIKFFQSAFFGKKYSYWNDLGEFWNKKRDVYTSSQLFAVLEEIPVIMGLESFSFFMFDRDRAVFVPLTYAGLDGVFDPEQAQVLNTIYPDDYLPVYLAKEKKIIIRDEIITQSEKNYQLLIGQMDKIKAQVSVPLFVTGRLTAILNLGPKKNQVMYHKQDMDLLNEVVRLAEKHLSHISFFESSLFFSGSVAHDIRKPFRQGIIYAYIEDIRKGLENSQNISSAKEALGNLKHLLGNLHNMSEDMVDAFKNLEIFLKSGFKPQKIDYAEKINKESESFKIMAKEKGIVFEADLPKKRFFLYADPLSVERILNELFTNAIKYTDKGKITVRVSQENLQEVLTEIGDTGCGIQKEEQDEIWELFKRGKNGQEREGAGIGLAMVRQLVEANGGKIWVNSGKDKGSSFFFNLPAWEGKDTERRK